MEYELVWEIKNHCPNNQIRDIFFEEVETEDPVSYVKTLLKDQTVELTWEKKETGAWTVHATGEGPTQVFLFTPI